MRSTTKGTTLHDLLIEELKDMYNAEQQMVKTLPKLAKAAGSDELRAAFEEHLEQTKGHVERIERAFEMLDVPARGRKCAGMEGLIDEGKEMLGERLPESVQDAALIGAAQKVEHYEIAAYGTARTHAQLLDLNEVADLLEQTLEEEKQTDAKLSELAEDINVEAESGSDGETAMSGNGRRRSTRR
ncbi:MAG: ferritin-like domain-containing protein [Candidatus Eremiobacteraeota bacterium]|nr:ferritin-like domain-containing protein [Candidatus Eremiobacteraeota bacterium]MBV8365528.1 ferritin-like domain-containing protein [Candidatus Eremiobacteraeota bacterium]